VNSNKRSPGARGVPQPFKPQETKGPQFKPVVAQLKTGVQSSNRPVAPPVYRPQPVPRVLQTKKALVPKPFAGQAPRQPVAPPPGARTIVQPKTNPQLLKPLATPFVRSPMPNRFVSVIQRAAEKKAPAPPTAEELAQWEHEFFNLGAGQYSQEAKAGDPDSEYNYGQSVISGILYSFLQSIDTANRTFRKFRSRKIRDSATTKRWVLDLTIDLANIEGLRREHTIVLDIHFDNGAPTGVGSCWVQGVGGQDSAVRSQECPALARLYAVWLAGYNADRW